MLSQPALDEALKTLRYCISAGEHLPEATWRAWKERTGIAITDGIGSTEMMHIFVSAAGDDIRPGSTGKAVPGYTATVLDADGNPLDEGVGRLAIKGPTGCRYLDDPRQRDYVVERLERHRRHLPQGRRRLLLVPRAQRRHDRQLGLQYRRAGGGECAAVAPRGRRMRGHRRPLSRARAEGEGVRGARGGLPKPRDELVAELQAHAKAQIAPYKYPREIEFVDALPKTATGKLRRGELRNRAKGA